MLPLEFHIEFQSDPNPNDEAVLFQGIKDYSLKAKNMPPMEPFAFFIKNEKKQVLAGASGVTYYGCLYVDTLWVHSDYRKMGWGTQLMNESESLAKKRQCTFATVATMDWEALPFYQKLGYQIEFTRTGYVQNSQLYMLRKNL